MTEKFAVVGGSSFSGASFMGYLLDHKAGTVRGFSRRSGLDLNNPEPLQQELALFKPDYVVNFAALNMVADSWQHAADYYQTNVVGTSRLVDFLRGQPWLKKYVHVSTPEVYGSTGASLAEDAPFRPSTPYAVSRAAADMHLRCLHTAYGFPVCFTRSVNVYGPGQQLYRIIPKTILSALRGEKLALHGGGASTRSFIHIDDVCEATLRVAVNGRPGDTYHTSTMRQTSIRGLVKMICEMMGAKFEAVAADGDERLGKDMNYQLDSTKIRRELGWFDKVSLESGLLETIDWFAKRSQLFKGMPLEYEHRA